MTRSRGQSTNPHVVLYRIVNLPNFAIHYQGQRRAHCPDLPGDNEDKDS